MGDLPCLGVLLPTCLPTYLSTYPPTYLSAFLPTKMSTNYCAGSAFLINKSAVPTCAVLLYRQDTPPLLHPPPIFFNPQPPQHAHALAGF
eukprot:352100-Chlamydomonas_euryale.AAC.2